MSFAFRGLASFLASLSLAVALPAAAGDVDTHLDRARGKAEVIRAHAGGATSAPIHHLAAAGRSSEIEVARGQVVTVVVAPRGEQACSCDVRAR